MTNTFRTLFFVASLAVVSSLAGCAVESDGPANVSATGVELNGLAAGTTVTQV